jgi:hypothetical protein
MKNLAKSYRQAGIKGMSESNGGSAKAVKKDCSHLSKYSIVERLEGESFQDWKARCTKTAD